MGTDRGGPVIASSWRRLRSRTRLRYSDVAYFGWFLLAVFSAVAAVFAVVFGQWAWVLGFTVAALALSAHARLERFDGHGHRGGGVDVP